MLQCVLVPAISSCIWCSDGMLCRTSSNSCSARWRVISIQHGVSFILWRL